MAVSPLAPEERPLNSFQDVARNLGPGQFCIIRPTSGLHTTELLSRLQFNLAATMRVATLSWGSSHAAGRRGVVYEVDLSTYTNLHKSLAGVKSALRRFPRKGIVIVDVQGLSVAEHKRSDVEQFIHRVFSFLKRDGYRSFWILSPSVASPELLPSLKEQAQFFISLFRVGSLSFLQVQSARALLSNLTYLPRPIEYAGKDLIWGDPVIPTSSEVTTREGEVPAVNVADAFEQGYRRLFGSTKAGIVLFDLTGEYRDANRRARELLGYDESEFLNVPLRDLVAPESYRQALSFLVSLRRNRSVHGELSLKRKSGRTLPVELNAGPVDSKACSVIFFDATESNKQQRQLQESEAFHRQAFDDSRIATGIFQNRRLVYSNPAFRSQFGIDHSRGVVTLKDLLGKRNADALKSLNALAQDGEMAGESVYIDLLLQSAGGKELVVDVTGTHTVYSGRPALQCQFVDVTVRTERERKLRESESHYRRLVDHSPEAILIVEGDTIVYANPRSISLFGFTNVDEIRGREFLSLIRTRDRKRASEELYGKKPKLAEQASVVFATAKSNSRPVFVEAITSRVPDLGKAALLVTCRDVTVKMSEVEEERARVKSVDFITYFSRALRIHGSVGAVLDSAVELSMKAFACEFGGAYIVDRGSPAIHMSGARGLPEKLTLALTDQDTREGIVGFVAKTLEPLVLSVDKYPPHLPYKSLFVSENVRTVIYLPLHVEGRLGGIVFLASAKALDLEDYQHLMLQSMALEGGVVLEAVGELETLRKSEGLYRDSVENIAEAMYRLMPNGVVTYISPVIEKLLGYRQESFLASPDFWRTIVHPDDRPTYSRRVVGQSGENEFVTLEYRMLPKGKATYLHIRDSVRYLRGADGEIESIVGLLTKVDEQPESSEPELTQDTLRANALESINEGVFVFNTELHIIDWNSAMERMTGVKREEMFGANPFDRLPALFPEKHRVLIASALTGEPVSTDDTSYPVGGAADGYVWARYTPLMSSDGSIQGVVGVMTDVTKRKQLEREVRESEETLRKVIDAMGDALMISDLQGRVWEVNKEFTQLTGYPRSEVLGREFPYPWVMDEEMAKFVTWIASLRDRNYLRDFDMTWQHKGGERVFISLNTTLLRNAFGEPVAMLNIARDISDRRKLATELEHKNKQIELVNRIISKGNTTLDFREIFGTVAQEVYNLVPYDQISVGVLSDDKRSLITYACVSPTGVAKPVGEKISLEQSVARIAIDRQTPVVVGTSTLGAQDLKADGNLKSQICIPILLNDRVLGTFSVGQVSEEAFTGAEVEYLQPIAEQIGAIIDRVQLFQRVSEDSEYIHTLLNSIDSVVYTVDAANKITAVNKAWRPFALSQGLTAYADEGAVIGSDLRGIIVSAPLWKTLQRVIPDLFKRKVDYYSQEVETTAHGERNHYHLSINPMVVNDVVTSLVFTYTDITGIKRAEEEIRRRNKELVSLNAISTSISSSLNMDEVLGVASTQIREVTGAEFVLIYLQDRLSGQVELASSLGLSEDLAEQIRVLSVSSSSTGQVMRKQESLLIGSGLGTDERVLEMRRDVFRTLGLHAMASIPLQSKDRTIGTMELLFSQPRQFPDQEQQLLRLIGNQMGGAVENVQLYDEVQAQVQRITSLYELGRGLTGTLDLQVLLQTVYAGVSKSIPLDRFSYWTITDDRTELLPVYEVDSDYQTYYKNPSDRVPQALEQTSFYWQVIQDGTARIGPIADEKGEVWSCVAAAVRSNQRVAGILRAMKRGRGVYDETHLRLLESIANLTEIALEKARLYEDTVTKSLEIETRNRELDDFTYVVSHDLKEPLISIEGYSKIVLQEANEAIPPDARDYLSLVVQSSTRMKGLIDDLLTLSRLGRVAEMTELVAVGEVVEDILRELQFSIRAKNCSVTVSPSLPRVRYNPTQLSMVFRNLIANALKFSDKPDPRIEIGFTLGDREHIFSISDNGIGIDPQYFNKVFVIFQRLHRGEEYRGTGAGLTIVKKIVELHRGRIWLDSTPGVGTTFYFTVPS